MGTGNFTKCILKVLISSTFLRVKNAIRQRMHPHSKKTLLLAHFDKFLEFFSTQDSSVLRPKNIKGGITTSPCRKVGIFSSTLCPRKALKGLSDEGIPVAAIDGK